MQDRGTLCMPSTSVGVPSWLPQDLSPLLGPVTPGLEVSEQNDQSTSRVKSGFRAGR